MRKNFWETTDPLGRDVICTASAYDHITDRPNAKDRLVHYKALDISRSVVEVPTEICTDTSAPGTRIQYIGTDALPIDDHFLNVVVVVETDRQPFEVVTVEPMNPRKKNSKRGERIWPSSPS